MEDLHEHYNKLKEQFNLPEFDALNHEFEIETIEAESFLLRNLRRKVIEKLESVSKVLEDILQPDQHLCSLTECKYFNDDEKKEVFELYRKIMVILRQSLRAEIVDGDKENADFIIMLFQEWNNIKDDLIKITTKLVDSWEHESESESRIEYFG